jgi:hypothetical protein
VIPRSHRDRLLHPHLRTLLNQALYETIGRGWYQVAGEEEPAFVDFLAYALTKLLGLMDVLDLAKSHHWAGAAYVRQAAWPASTLLAGFKAFFSLVLLQQIFASLRQGKLLAETITDFWSPHGPIHERARNALAQYGARAIGPLLVSLRSVPSLTKEQQYQLPLILATIGPSTIPALVRHLNDPHEHVRAIAAAALGQLHALDTMPLLAPVRTPATSCQSVVSRALGILAGAGAGPPAKRAARPGPRIEGAGIRWWFWSEDAGAGAHQDPVELAVATLESALADDAAAVRTQAARRWADRAAAAAVTPG